jgi:hypothetical protein
MAKAARVAYSSGRTASGAKARSYSWGSYVALHTVSVSPR